MKLKPFLFCSMYFVSATALNMAVAVASPRLASTDQAKDQATSSQTTEKLDAYKNISAEEKAFWDKWHVTGEEPVVYRRLYTATELEAYKAVNPEDKDFAERKKTISFAEFNALAAKGKEFKFSKMTGNGKVTFSQQSAEEIKAFQASIGPVNLKAGEAFPAFNFIDTNGKKVDNSIFKGRITLVNFMFDKCVPCIAEVPALNQFADKHKEIQTLAMTFDNLEAAKAFTKQYKFSWPIISGSQELILMRLGLSTFPAYFLIDEEGRLMSDGNKSELKMESDKVLASLEKWVSSFVDGKSFAN